MTRFLVRLGLVIALAVGLVSLYGLWVSYSEVPASSTPTVTTAVTA